MSLPFARGEAKMNPPVAGFCRFNSLTATGEMSAAVRQPVPGVAPPQTAVSPCEIRNWSRAWLNAFAIATVLGLQYPPLSPALGLLAAAIAASRIVMGLHFASDVLAGAVLGSAIGLACFVALLG